MEGPRIEARGLDKSFGATPILRGVNLAVSAGSAALIGGRNGSGKSTLIRILAGLAGPTAGEARLFGRPSARLEADQRRRVGLLTHQSFLYRNLTGRENLEFVAKLYGLSERARVIDAWLDRIGLRGAAAEMVRGYSRGMEQRLALARALITAPDALLIDEPFTALDQEGVATASVILGEAATRGCAIVMTAHQVAPIEGLRCELYELARGRLIASADAQGGGALRRRAG